MDPATFFESCTYDICASWPEIDIACDDIAGYASVCHQMGVVIGVWRSEDFCPLQCPLGKVYDPCGPACPPTCHGLVGDCMDTPCVEGCFCPMGYLLSGNECVKPDDCGCFYNGRYYHVGEVMVNQDCSVYCVCKGRDVMECWSLICHINAFCGNVHGIHGCHCEHGYIGDGENCFMDDYETCIGWGDVHHETFDDTKYDFQGLCEYMALRPQCSNDTKPFYVTVDYEYYSPGLSVTRSVTFVSILG
ncbi:zonadhesin-like, partial [Saccoglossus kowalevskii]|uniref:IgGFc-binding protein-like n=1 Tax=Saccoglossus kowalevskii TaxID=10224 RepID=A0ABM0LU45_SACKO